MHLYTQLNFGGNCEEAFRYYEKLLGGTITMMFRASDAPNAKADSGNAVIHARMNVAGVELIGNDVPAEHFQKMRSVYLYLSLDSTAEVDRVYAALSDGGEIFMPLAETFFATKFAMLRDRFGVSWALIHERPR